MVNLLRVAQQDDFSTHPGTGDDPLNLNYGTAINTAKVMIEDENVAITPDYLAIEVAIDGLSASQATIKKAKTVFASMGIDGKVYFGVLSDNGGAYGQTLRISGLRVFGNGGGNKPAKVRATATRVSPLDGKVRWQPVPGAQGYNVR